MKPQFKALLIVALASLTACGSDNTSNDSLQSNSEVDVSCNFLADCPSVSPAQKNAFLGRIAPKEAASCTLISKNNEPLQHCWPWDSCGPTTQLNSCQPWDDCAYAKEDSWEIAPTTVALHVGLYSDAACTAQTGRLSETYVHTSNGYKNNANKLQLSVGRLTGSQYASASTNSQPSRFSPSAGMTDLTGTHGLEVMNQASANWEIQHTSKGPMRTMIHCSGPAWIPCPP